MKVISHTIALSIAAVLAGCQTFDAERHDEEQSEVFGASVQNMIQSQIASPQAPDAAPGAAAIDGDKAVDAVKTYRTDKAHIEGGRTPATLLMPSQILDR